MYSFGGVFSKTAADKKFLSFPFCLFYGLSLLVLFIYAIGWQQFIKRLPLTAAYANKAVTVIWGCIWGIFIFGEQLTLRNIIGAVLVIAGVVLFSVADTEDSVEAVDVLPNSGVSGNADPFIKDSVMKDMKECSNTEEAPDEH